MAGTPPGFIEAEVRAGLHAAMEFGRPTGTDEAVVFHVPTFPSPPGAAFDQDGVPYDPTMSRSAPTYELVSVLCAVEYLDRQQAFTNPDILGSGVTNSVLRLTMLDEEYEQIRGFDWCSVKSATGTGTERYWYRRTAPAIGMGTIDVFMVYCEAEDES